MTVALRLALRRALSYHRMVTGRENGRLVYSSDVGRICPACGLPMRDCSCGPVAAVASTADRLVAKLRIEKKGRGGKTVTVVDGLPRNAALLKALGQELKRVCGTGGAIADGALELQGDLRDRVRGVLLTKGYLVKG
jgi:translation initiation factor 1